MHDVLVVGGSIAGAATAIHLRRLGRQVLLVDRAGFPRRKACGEGLFPRGVAELQDLGVWPALKETAAELSTLRFTIRGQSAEARLGSPERPAVGIQREALDAALLDRCRALGVDVRTNVEAQALVERESGFAVRIGGDILEPRAIVAADGLRSRLRSQAGLDRPQAARRYGVSAHMHLKEPPLGRIDVFFEPGYEVYVTPVGGNVVNVAVLLGRRQARGLAGNLQSTFLELLARSAFAAEGELVDEPLAVGPFPAGAKRVWQRNLVLVGDAAGFLDPINGEGMTAALVSARQCAAAVHAFLSSGSTAPLRAYQRQREDLVRAPNLFARTMLALASRPALGRRAVLNLSRQPETFARLVAMNGCDLPLSFLRPRDLLALATGL